MNNEWLDEILDKVINQYGGFGGACMSQSDAKQQILAHYARPTKAQLELVAKAATLEQKVQVMEATYLKPEDVEDIAASINGMAVALAETGHYKVSEMLLDIKGQLSKLNREEEKDE